MSHAKNHGQSSREVRVVQKSDQTGAELFQKTSRMLMRVWHQGEWVYWGIIRYTKHVGSKNILLHPDVVSFISVPSIYDWVSQEIWTGNVAIYFRTLDMITTFISYATGHIA